MEKTATWVLKNAHIVCPRSGVDEKMHLLIKEGRIAEWISPSSGELLPSWLEWDAKGAFVIPGLIEPAFQFYAFSSDALETLEEVRSQGSLGGFTTYISQPHTQLLLDDKNQLTHLQSMTKEQGLEVFPTGSLVRGKGKDRLANMGELAQAGAVAFSDGVGFLDEVLLKDALHYAKTFSKPIFLNPNPSHRQLGLVNEGKTSTHLGLPGIWPVAEVTAVAQCIELARFLEVSVIIGPISCEQSVEMIANGKAKGLSVWGLAPVWNLIFDEDMLIERPYDTNFHFSPPLRKVSDKLALRKGVCDGSLLVTCQHQPVLKHKKEVEFAFALPGAMGLSTALSALLTYCPEIPLSTWVSAMSNEIATCLLPSSYGHLGKGAFANFFLVSKEESQTISPYFFSNRCQNSPLLSTVLKGKPEATFIKGIKVPCNSLK